MRMVELLLRIWVRMGIVNQRFRDNQSQPMKMIMVIVLTFANHWGKGWDLDETINHNGGVHRRGD